MELKKKIVYSIDLGLFLTGIILVLLSANGNSTIEIRAIIGELAILSSYFLFPFIGAKKKEKQFQSFCLHTLFFLISIFIGYFALNVYIKNMKGAVWWQEILAPLGLLIVISYYSYILISFIKSFYDLASKLMSYLLSTNTKETYSNTKKIIEKITAFIVTLTALAASITALITAIKKIV